eukprot:1385723-Pyramimonas_sp.AAC.1
MEALRNPTGVRRNPMDVPGNPMEFRPSDGVSKESHGVSVAFRNPMDVRWNPLPFARCPEDFLRNPMEGPWDLEDVQGHLMGVLRNPVDILRIPA